MARIMGDGRCTSHLTVASTSTFRTVPMTSALPLRSLWCVGAHDDQGALFTAFTTITAGRSAQCHPCRLLGEEHFPKLRTPSTGRRYCRWAGHRRCHPERMVCGRRRPVNARTNIIQSVLLISDWVIKCFHLCAGGLGLCTGSPRAPCSGHCSSSAMTGEWRTLGCGHDW